MNNKKERLRVAYERACNDYVRALAKQWDWDFNGGWWVGNEVGGIFMYGDDTFIDIKNIILCVNNNVTQSEYLEWVDYSSFATEFHQNVPNFGAWLNGCPRLSKEQRDKLISLKQDFDDACDHFKEQIK